LRQGELAALEDRSTRGDVELQPVDAEDTRSGGGVEPPHDRPDPRNELAQAVRLDEIVVRAELQADDPVDLLASCADDDDRHPRPLAQPPADLETVDVRKP